MKRLLLTVLTICSLGVGLCDAQDREIRGLTDKLAESLAQSGKKTVAVVDFTDLQGNVTELGRFLAEEISASLAESVKGIQVVDRTNLEVIIQENRLVHRGIIDPATAKKLGQIAGVDALITGNLTQFGDSVHLSIKILDTDTARIVGATRGDIPKTKAIEELLGREVASATNGPQPLVPPIAQPSPKAVHPSTEVMGIRIVADNCRAEAERLVCTLILTSEQQDQQLMMQVGAGSYNSSLYARAYDDHGVENGADTILIGGKVSDNFAFGQIRSLLVSGIPTPLVAKFNKFNVSSGMVTLLAFGLDIDTAQGNNGSITKFELRNIPVLR